MSAGIKQSQLKQQFYEENQNFICDILSKIIYHDNFPNKHKHTQIKLSASLNSDLYENKSKDKHDKTNIVLKFLMSFRVV